MTGFDATIAPDVLADAKAGGRRGMEAIYRAFERPVYSLARRMCGCPQAAADVTQDTFMQAFRCLHQYRGEAPLGHWLRRLAATQALMHLRAGRRWLELFDGGEALADPGGFEQASTADLEHGLALLPALPRAVLWLYHVEGYTHAEIARMAHRSVSFSKSQLARAHQKLRQLLELPPTTEGAVNAAQVYGSAV